MRTRLFLASVLSLSLLFIVACSLSNTADKYSEIKTGMTQQEVERILGKPDNIAAMTIGNFGGTNASWRISDKKIVIQFVNDKVVMKSILPLEKGDAQQ